MKTIKNYGVELSAKGRHSKLAQEIWGEGLCIFVYAYSVLNAKLKVLKTKFGKKNIIFPLIFLKTTIC